MKKAIVALLVLIMIFSSVGAYATEFYQYTNPCEVPSSLYQEPYMDSQISTTYAPWLKNIHLASRSELERGAYAGEACQQIRSFAVSPIDPSVMFFGTDTTGIFKTSNGGKSWFNTNNGYPGVDSQGILCDVLDKNIVYYVAKGTGVARSKDGGRHWEELIKNKGTTINFQNLLAMDAAGNLYAAINSGIYKLDRKTDTVTNLYDKFATVTGDKGIYFHDIDVSADGMHIYAIALKNSNDDTAEYGVFTSHDGGQTWEVKGGTEEKFFGGGTLAIHPENPMNVFIGGRYYDKVTGTAETYMLYETTDGCETLQAKFTLNYENLEEGVSKTPVLFYFMAFGPKGENGIYPLYVAGNKMTWNYVVSYDYGASFSRVITPELGRITEETSTSRYDAGGRYTGYWAQSFAPDMTKPGRVMLNYLGPAEYYNGTLKTTASGFSGASVTDIALDSQLRPFLVTVDVKAFLWESGSLKNGDVLTVKAMHVGESSDANKKEHTFTRAVFDPNDDNHLIAYVAPNNAKPDFDGVRQSFNKGATWEPFNEETIFPKGKASRGVTKVLCYDKDDSNTIYTTYHTSYDNGKTWQRNPVDIMAISDDCKRFLGMVGSGSDAVFHISEDKGKTWKATVKPGFSTDLKGIFFDTLDPDCVWIANASNVRKVNLVSGTKENYISQLGGGKVNRINCNPEVPGHIIVCSSPGLIKSDKDFKIAETRDGGKTWNSIPGSWGGLFGSITFVDGMAYIGGHQGTFQYDYKKYWEFLANKITVQLNGKEISFSVMPEIIEGRTMVPMRELFEMLGATVTWDGDTRTVTANKGKNSVKLQIDNLTVNMNGEEKQMEAAPYIRNGRTMVPLRFASEALGIRVGWDSANKLIVMISE